ncbi:MAG: hypothetical protein ACKVP2_00100 [Burkholderiales bacterium]
MRQSRSVTRLPGVFVSTAIVLSILCGTQASAQSRWVFVNGQRLNDRAVAELERLQCTDIPDGAYWLNTQNGAWGYMGNWQVQGVLGDRCNKGGDSGSALNRDGTYGPFVTMRRAEEEANRYRAQGFHAVAFHNGDGYYVRVSR